MCPILNSNRNPQHLLENILCILRLSAEFRRVLQMENSENVNSNMRISCILHSVIPFHQLLGVSFLSLCCLWCLCYCYQVSRINRSVSSTSPNVLFFLPKKTSERYLNGDAEEYNPTPPTHRMMYCGLGSVQVCCVSVQRKGFGIFYQLRIKLRNISSTLLLFGCSFCQRGVPSKRTWWGWRRKPGIRRPSGDKLELGGFTKAAAAVVLLLNWFLPSNDVVLDLSPALTHLL